MSHHTDPPPSAEPTPVRGPWTVIHDMCQRTGGRCYAASRAALRVGQAAHVQDHGLRLAIIGRRMVRLVELLDSWSMTGRGAPPAAFAKACDDAMKTQEKARAALLVMGITL